jgi:hypothetical protein
MINDVLNGGYNSSLENSSLLRETFNATRVFTAFFEKKTCLIKDCSFSSDIEKSSVTILISFLIVKRRKKQKSLPLLPEHHQNTSYLFTIQKIFRILKRSGYFSSKRLVFRNLNKVASSYRKSLSSRQDLQIINAFRKFKLESYYNSGVFLFYLIHTLKKSAPLFAKFVARFLKAVHRSKRKRIKFERFISSFVENIMVRAGSQKSKNIRGFKVEIKGRFERDKRSKKLVFQKGSIPLQTVFSPVNYSFTPSYTSFGVFGIKVWVLE